jgi:hypothetical protein
MATPNRIDINRANSQHSTGPKTVDGKQKSSQNALTHGLTSQTAVMPTEDLEAYQSHVESFEDEYAPETATEANLVRSLADASWLLNRVATLETKILTSAESLESQSKALSNLSMHSQRLSRQFERTVTQLRDLQKTRRAQEAEDLEHYLDITEMYEANGEPYDATDDGFDFSEDQINVAQRTRNRARSIDEAIEYQEAA